MTRQFYRPDEVAEILNIGVSTVREMIRNGKLKANRFGETRNIRVSAKELDRFIKASGYDPFDLDSCSNL